MFRPTGTRECPCPTRPCISDGLICVFVWVGCEGEGAFVLGGGAFVCLFRQNQSINTDQTEPEPTLFSVLFPTLLFPVRRKWVYWNTIYRFASLKLVQHYTGRIKLKPWLWMLIVFPVRRFSSDRHSTNILFLISNLFNSLFTLWYRHLVCIVRSILRQ